MLQHTPVVQTAALVVQGQMMLAPPSAAVLLTRSKSNCEWFQRFTERLRACRRSTIPLPANQYSATHCPRPSTFLQVRDGPWFTFCNSIALEVSHEGGKTGFGDAEARVDRSKRRRKPFGNLPWPAVSHLPPCFLHAFDVSRLSPPSYRPPRTN